MNENDIEEKVHEEVYKRVKSNGFSLDSQELNLQGIYQEGAVEVHDYANS